MDGKTVAQHLTCGTDRGALRELIALLEVMPEAELERFYRGTFDSLTVAHIIFQRRFPKAFARVDAEIQGDDPMRLT